MTLAYEFPKPQESFSKAMSHSADDDGSPKSAPNSTSKKSSTSTSTSSSITVSTASPRSSRRSPSTDASDTSATYRLNLPKDWGSMLINYEQTKVESRPKDDLHFIFRVGGAQSTGEKPRSRNSPGSYQTSPMSDQVVHSSTQSSNQRTQYQNVNNTGSHKYVEVKWNEWHYLSKTKEIRKDEGPKPGVEDKYSDKPGKPEPSHYDQVLQLRSKMDAILNDLGRDFNESHISSKSKKQKSSSKTKKNGQKKTATPQQENKSPKSGKSSGSKGNKSSKS